MVAERNSKLPKHPELENIPNLHVIKALTSLHSKGFVREQFAWRHHYWYLTNEGTRYLRDFLHLPSEIVPATMKYKKPSQEAASRPTTTSIGLSLLWGSQIAPRQGIVRILLLPWSRMRDGGEGDRGAY